MTTIEVTAQATLSGRPIPGFPYHARLIVGHASSFVHTLTQTVDWEFLFKDYFAEPPSNPKLLVCFLQAHGQCSITLNDPLHEAPIPLLAGSVFGWMNNSIGNLTSIEIKATTIPLPVTVVWATLEGTEDA